MNIRNIKKKHEIIIIDFKFGFFIINRNNRANTNAIIQPLEVKVKIIKVKNVINIILRYFLLLL
jgi:hypothetical protein